MWLKLPTRNRRNTDNESPLAVGLLTVPQIERGIRMRRHAWGKPIQQIADDAGVNAKVINAVLRGERVSDASYAILTTYLRTPSGPWARINNRKAKASPTGPRRPFESRLRRLCVVAVNHKLHVAANTRVASMTLGQMKAYYWRLDFQTKERIIDANFDVCGRYPMSDFLEAWEWLERISKIRQHLTTSAKKANVPG